MNISCTKKACKSIALPLKLMMLVLLFTGTISPVCAQEKTRTVKVHPSEKMGRNLSADERKELIFLAKVKGVERVTGYDFTNVRNNRKYKRAMRRGTGVNRFVREMYPNLRVRVSAKGPANPENQFIRARDNPRLWTCNMEVTVHYKIINGPPENKPPWGIVAGLMYEPRTISIPLDQNGTWGAMPESSFYGGISFPLGSDMQTLAAITYNDKLPVKTQFEEVHTDLYGGKITMGAYKSGFNPNFGAFYMQGQNPYGVLAMNGFTAGADLLKSDWKLGLELVGYWIKTNMEVGGQEAEATELIDIDTDKMRITVGISLKLYFGDVDQ